MLLSMADEVQFRFLCPAEVKTAVENVFDRQGTSYKEGAVRLLRWFAEQTPEIQAIILGQVKGNAAALLAAQIVKKK